MPDPNLVLRGTRSPREARIISTDAGLARRYLDHFHAADGSLPAVRLGAIMNAGQIAKKLRRVQTVLDSVGITDLETEGELALDGSMLISQGVLKRSVAITPSNGGMMQPEIERYEVLRPVASAHVMMGGVGHSARVRTRTRRARRLRFARPLMAPRPSTLEVGEAVIAAKKLVLRKGLHLVIEPEVRYLTIVALEIEIEDDVVIAWAPGEKPARGMTTPSMATSGKSYNPNAETGDSKFYSPSGGHGATGAVGLEGYGGEAGPLVDMWAVKLNRMPNIALPGQVGGVGGPGQGGGNGGHGARGLHSAANAFNCLRGPGHGGNGGNGGDGGPGGPGGVGGEGGHFAVFTPHAVHEKVLDEPFTIDLSGGLGGDGGPGGSGGSRGLGGKQGSREWLCATAHDGHSRNGSKGSDGSGGAIGVAGDTGDAGSFRAAAVDISDIVKLLTQPRIDRLEPWTAPVGALVTGHGAHLTPGCKVKGKVNGSMKTLKTKFISDSLLQIDTKDLGAGRFTLRVHDDAGDKSPPFVLKLVPKLNAFTPPVAALGNEVVLTAEGVPANAKVLFRGFELGLTHESGNDYRFTLPRPTGPFEESGGAEGLVLRTAEGDDSEPLDLTIRHSLDTGFQVPVNGLGFSNSAAAAAGVADWGTFEDTYGADIYGSALLPLAAGSFIGVGAVAAFYLFYEHFFNTLKPGYSSGFAMVSAAEFWSQNPSLAGQYATLGDAEERLTIAQGRIMSEELLEELHEHAKGGWRHAKKMLDEIEERFSEMLGASDSVRRKIAPVMQVIPAGSIWTGIASKLEESHGLLPIRIEYPVDGEPWYRRLFVYENAGDKEAWLEFTKHGDDFPFEMKEGNMAYKSSDGWTLGVLPLEKAYFDDVDLPLNIVAILCPTDVLIKDAQGRRFGTDGSGTYAEIPKAYALPGTAGCVVMPFEEAKEIELTGTAPGEYTLAVCSSEHGTGCILNKVPIQSGEKDTVNLGQNLDTLVFETSGADKPLTVHYGRLTGDVERGAIVQGVKAESGKKVAFVPTPDFREMTLLNEGDAFTADVMFVEVEAGATREARNELSQIDGQGAARLSAGAWTGTAPAVTVQPESLSSVLGSRRPAGWQ